MTGMSMFWRISSKAVEANLLMLAVECEGIHEEEEDEDIVSIKSVFRKYRLLLLYSEHFDF